MLVDDGFGFCDDFEQFFWEFCFVGEFFEMEGGEWGQFGGFQYDGVVCGECWCEGL